MGFNCAAVDQRSGGDVNGVENETHARAAKAGKNTSYLDAYQDMEAALAYFRAEHAKGKLIVWGSSYSASLVLKLAAEHPDAIDGVVAFSPGEYFIGAGKPTNYITELAAGITCPVFITSAKNEHSKWSRIYNAIPSEKKRSFLPETDGNHGSRSLWEKFSDHQAYWTAVTAFLKENFGLEH